jgi:hypothetical protein
MTQKQMFITRSLNRSKSLKFTYLVLICDIPFNLCEYKNNITCLNELRLHSGKFPGPNRY